MKPGPKPDPALRARSPKWYRRGRAVNGPENYDPLERGFFYGRPASALSECAKDQAAFTQGQNRCGAGKRFVTMSSGFITALWAYMRVKRALYLICCPFRPKKTNSFTPPYKPKSPRQSSRSAWRQPAAKDWARLDREYGFDVRMTSPTHVIARARRLRRLVWDGPCIGLETDKPCRPRPPQVHVSARPKREPEDLFTIWPPVTLPNLPRSTRRKAAPALAAIRDELYATPQPRPLSLVTLNMPYDHAAYHAAENEPAYAAPGACPKARASPGIRGP